MTPFSRWEKELPKLITDPRYTAVSSLKERRLIFDDFCKTSADEHKRSKAERAKKSREDFQALLEEAAKAGTLGENPLHASFLGRPPWQASCFSTLRAALEVVIVSTTWSAGTRACPCMLLFRHLLSPRCEYSWPDWT